MTCKTGVGKKYQQNLGNFEIKKTLKKLSHEKEFFLNLHKFNQYFCTVFTLLVLNILELVIVLIFNCKLLLSSINFVLPHPENAY